MLFNRDFKHFTFLLLALVISTQAFGYTLSGGRLVEDFSTDDYADYTATTGLWNLVDHIARAGAVANGVATRPITFGDGSDGILNTSGGMTFDTNTHPTGFNYKSVNITGGAITVTGAFPLIIRSLTTVNITPAISVDGGAGAVATGGTAIAGRCAGGDGGTGVVAAPGTGGDGFIFDGSQEALSGGAGATLANATDGNATATLSGANFDAANTFICGGGGAGGGAESSGVVLVSGGAGGAGGGTIRITSVGTLTVGATTANGGNGVNGTNNGGFCSGNGAGGHGGAIWFQTLKVLTTGADPTENFGTGGTSPCTGAGADGTAGQDRGDSTAGGRPVWATTGTDFDTDNAAPNQTYIVQSKAYDLNTLNAGFASQASITQNAGGGSVTVKFAGSVDGKTFSPFTTDLISLSDKNFRYLKFQVVIVTAAVAAASPQVSQIAIDFKDLGLERLDMKLTAGCASIRDISKNGDSNGSTSGIADLLFWMAFWILTYGLVRNERRAANRKLPT